MKYPCFDIDKLDLFFQTECYRKDDNVFVMTHIPMNFRLKPMGQQTYQIASEEELIPLAIKGWRGVLEYRSLEGEVITDFPSTQVILIRGYTGTGKTELCRYVEHALKKEEFFKEKIRRSKSIRGRTLDEYLKLRRRIQCIRIEKGHLSAVGALMIPIVIESMGQEDLVANKIKELSIHIKRGFHSFLSIRAQTDPSYYEGLIPNLKELLSDEERFSFIISDNIDAHIRHLREIEASKKERLKTLSLITKDDLNRFGIEAKPKEVQEINAGLLEALSHLMFRGGITQALESFIKQMNNQQIFPVIIMDDLSLVNRINLRHIFDFLTGIAGIGYKCTIVIGMTTGVFLEEVGSIRSNTLAPRINEIDLSEKDENIAEWLDERKTLNFVEKYLSLIRRLECPSDCPEPCLNISESLYPFNPDFVLRLRRYLHQTELGLTPRGLISVLYEILTSEEPAYRAADAFFRNQRSADYEPLAALSEKVKRKWEDLALASYWYGKVTDRDYRVDKEIAMALNLITEKSTSTPLINIDEKKVSIPIRFRIIKEKGEEEKKEKPKDREPLFKDLARAEQWIAGEQLNPNTGSNLESIIQKTLEAVSDGDLRTLRRETSYNPKAWLAWRHGNNPRIIFSSKDIIAKGEPSIIFTPPTVESDNPLIFQLSEDDIKQLLQDYHSQRNISENFIASNLWRLRLLCKEYRKSLKKYLEERMGINLEKYLSSCILFLDSISKGNFIPINKEEIETRLKEIIEESDKIEPKALRSLERLLPQAMVASVDVFSSLVKLFRGFVLLRESIVDIEEISRVAPSNKTELFNILKSCSVNIPLGFHIETPKRYRLKIILDNIRRLLSEVMKTEVDFNAFKEQVEKWQKITSRFGSNLIYTLDEAQKELEQVSDALRLSGGEGYLLFRAISRDADKLVNNHPKEDDKRRLIHLLEMIQRTDSLEKNTEEDFILKTIYMNAESNPTITYLKDIEKWISDLRKDITRLPQTILFYKDIERSVNRISDSLDN